MQFSDIQETVNFSPDTLCFLRESLKVEKPDLAVLTGDQIKGYGISMAMGDSVEKAKNVIETIVSVFDELQIPFAVLFGNHDEFGSALKPLQWQMYKKSGYCVGITETQLNGYGIYNLPVKDKDGNVKLNIYCFDSGMRDTETHSYQTVDTDQIEWYKRKREELCEQNGGYVPSMVFQHIPVPEVYELMDTVSKRVKGAVKGAGIYSKNYYVIGSKTKQGGFMRENAAVPMKNSGEFAALCEKGDVMALFFGHDHINSFSGILNGIEMGYTQGCGFNVYGPGLERGARVFEIPEDDPRNFTHRTVTYRDIIGKKIRRPITSFVYNHSPSSVSVALDWAKKALAAGVGLSVAAGLLKYLKNN